VKRRQALQSLAGISVAGALPLRTLSQQQPAANTVSETPKLDTAVPDATAAALHLFFSADQFAALERLAEVLMPATGDSPGAQDAGVAEFLDFLISTSSTPGRAAATGKHSRNWRWSKSTHYSPSCMKPGPMPRPPTPSPSFSGPRKWM
jgi:hypothetical protein